MAEAVRTPYGGYKIEFDNGIERLITLETTGRPQGFYLGVRDTFQGKVINTFISFEMWNEMITAMEYFRRVAQDANST